MTTKHTQDTWTFLWYSLLSSSVLLSATFGLKCYDCHGPNFLDPGGVPCNYLPANSTMACYSGQAFCFTEASKHIDQPANTTTIRRGRLSDRSIWGDGPCIGFVDERRLTNELLAEITNRTNNLNNTSIPYSPQKYRMLCRCLGNCCNAWKLGDFSVLTQTVYLVEPVIKNSPGNGRCPDDVDETTTSNQTAGVEEKDENASRMLSVQLCTMLAVVLIQTVIDSSQWAH